MREDTKPTETVSGYQKNHQIILVVSLKAIKGMVSGASIAGNKYLIQGDENIIQN